MPLGFERLNERTQRPNACINFIKPLTSSSEEDQTIAKNFLERIAAQCYPVMKRDYITVMALEEYPANPEFLGRNFNAGEVIQLVLKDKAGRWLSFNFVQMVMMHELAHCKQMNHSKFFWQVRNRYADHMKELWAQKYEGEGVWGRGQNLTSGDFVHGRMPDNADIPEHLCGGTYRRARGRKRKRGQDDATKSKPSYAERQQKRIAKKFGIYGGGHELGEDELVRGALEQGKRRPGKPRVAGSKRARDLRANAALARFEAAKQEQQRQQTPELIQDDDSDTDSFDDDESADDLNTLNTLDKIKDRRGRDLYKVCGDEGEQDAAGQTELEDLKSLISDKPAPNGVHDESTVSNVLPNHSTNESHKDSETEDEGEPDTPLPEPEDAAFTREHGIGQFSSRKPATTPQYEHDHLKTTPKIPEVLRQDSFTPVQVARTIATCPICSLENELNSPTCAACSHVLHKSLVPNHWRCKSNQCQGGAYINPGDAGRCGLCGALKPSATSEKPMGVMGADVLRWE